jgi:hypothetical protein
VNEDEMAFVNAFITREKRARYLQLLATPKRRGDILGRLYHNLDLLHGTYHEVTGADKSADKVEQVLRSKGAREMCYVISPEPDIDQRTVPLAEILMTLFETDGVAILCCLPGRLAFYKAEDEAYLLERS